MHIRAPKDLALFISNHRKKLGLSQASIGKLVGLKQQTVSEFETRPESTQLDTLFRILSAVNLDMKLLSKNESEMQWKEEW